MYVRVRVGVIARVRVRVRVIKRITVGRSHSEVRPLYLSPTAKAI